jgi:MFS family permease
MRFSPSNEAFYVYAARAARGFGDGFAVIILPAYLSEIGFDAFRIGVIATAALLGTAVTTLTAGFLGKQYDLRNLLLITAFVMLATGVAIPSFEHLALLLPFFFVGTMNPQAGDIGMMVPLEQSVLARGATDGERTSIFSRYSLSGDLGTAAGTLAAAVPDALTSFGFSEINALKTMFYLYAALGALSAVLYRGLPAGQREETHDGAALGRSRGIVYKLTALFSLDAFAGGFAVQSLVALWLFQRFGISLSAISAFYFCTSILNAFSYLAAARIAKRVASARAGRPIGLPLLVPRAPWPAPCQPARALGSCCARIPQTRPSFGTSPSQPDARPTQDDGADRLSTLTRRPRRRCEPSRQEGG